MPKATAKKFSSLMSKPLLDRLKKEAEENGQSVRFVLERAVQHYLEEVVPSLQTIHPDIAQRTRKAIRKHDRLLHLLAKAE